MRIASLALPFAVAAGFSFLVAAPRTAEACGACFVPPITNTVVSYHRMVLSVSTKETTLYDQITYAGSPASFAWVLPIRGTAKVGISADLMFAAIDQQTQTSIIPPPTNCPAPPSCPGEGEDLALAPGSADAGTSFNGAGVNVLKEETVGPYETVQLESKVPTALTDWLTARNYNIPDDIKPLIASYVAEGFNFLALKLVPGSGVQSMRPVRVTTEGAGPSLPLRMIAAGSGASVGVTLWVVSDGRWEPQTFPSFVIPASDITWTWKTYRSNYDTLRAQKVTALGGAAWEIESSVDMSSYIIPNLLQQQQNYGGVQQLPDGGYGRVPIYDPELETDGGIAKDSTEVEDEDMQALFQGRTTVRITRMRSDLPRASLATDLALQASADQSVITNYRQLTKEADEPQCAVYDGCHYLGLKPRSEAQSTAKDQCGSPNAFCSSGGGCSVRAGSGTRSLAPFAVAALGLAAFVARRRRARR